MSETNFVLAVDTGTSRLVAATACATSGGGIEVASFAVGSERESTSVLAFVTDDGDLLFGEDAERHAIERPERALRDVIRRIGDDTPLIAGGFAVPAEQVLARLVLWIVASAANHFGTPPAAVALAHPADWQLYRIDLVDQALRSFDLDVTLVPTSVAAVREHLDAVEVSSGIRAVFDLGAASCTATIVRNTATGVRQLGAPVVIDGVGGIGYDDILLDHALTMAGVETQTVLSSAEGRAAMAEARSSVVAAKESLSFDGDAVMSVPLPDRTAGVRITRSEFEAMTGDDLDRAIDALEQALETAELDAAQLAEIVLVGGSSHIPLVVQRLSGRFDLPLSAAADPQTATARGAARHAWAVLAATIPVEPAATAAAVEDEDETVRRASLFAGLRARTVRISAPAASAAALTVTAVLVTGGIVLGTTAPAGDRSDAADAEVLPAGVGAADLLDLARHDSDFSAEGGIAPVEDADAALDGIGDAVGLRPTASSDQRHRPRQPSGGLIEASSPPRSTGTSGSGGSAPAPSSPGTGSGPGTPSTGPSPADPSPADPSPADPSPADPSPADPSPADPSPTDPSPSDPPPTDPQPSDPPPTDPQPSDPPPTDPSPTDPPIDPAPTDPTSPPAEPQPSEPDPSPSAAADPAPPPTDPSPPAP